MGSPRSSTTRWCTRSPRSARPTEVARTLHERCHGVVDRITPYAPYDVRAEVIDEVAHALRTFTDDRDEATATRRTA